MTKIIGIGLIIAGVGLAFWGYQLSDSISAQITQTVTGAHTDKVMALYITGAVSFVVGLCLNIKD